MRDKRVNKKNPDKEDIFLDCFRDKLEDHQMPVDERCWENISRRIQPAHTQGRRRRMLFYSVVAAAATVLALYWGIHAGLPKDEIYQNKPVSEKIDGENLPLKKAQERSLSDEVKAAMSSNRPLRSKIKVLKEENLRSGNPETKEIGKTDRQPFSEAVAVAEEQKQAVASVSSSDTSCRKQRSGSLNTRKERMDDQQIAFVPEHHQAWELGVSMNAFGSSSVSNANSGYPQTLSDLADSKVEQQFFSASPSQEIVDFAPPFSIGLLARKKMNELLSIETGLTYSFLSTSFRSLDRHAYTANLKLHYIGVPVNLVADVWRFSPQCKIYAGAGAMVEKGIKSEYSQDVSVTRQYITNVDDIGGFQWSLNASVGISYSMYKNLSFYLEPRVSHYFDNNQPVSIRTEKETIVGMSAGFRYDFK